MKLYIKPQGGIAGDMFSAALIDAGADKIKVINAMKAAAETLGRASVSHVKTVDGSSRLLISVEHHHGHLSSHKAFYLLGHLFEEFSIDQLYSDFGFKMLRALVSAEDKVHSCPEFQMDTLLFHHHQHDYSSQSDVKSHINKEGGNISHHDYNHTFYNEPEVWLHESQDILIDIMGAVMGLQELNAPVKAELTSPVSFGGGSVSFSNGFLNVPAPATQFLIDENNIPVAAGPINVELFTPTGASLLTALDAFKISDTPEENPVFHGKSRGTKDLPIPPLEIMIYE